jgi:uncharacterized membrane protein
MKHALSYATRSIIAGLLVVIPIYLAVLLMLKGMKSLVGLVKPFAMLLPEWLPAEQLLSLLLVLAICFFIGVAVRARGGAVLRERIERGLLEKIPGYSVIRSLTQQIAGESRGSTWKPALFQTDEGLLPAFIIEEHEDGRYTVFVPSIPTPFAGAVYVAERSKVHPVDVPFPDALRTVSRWGSGAKDLVAAMERKQRAALAAPTAAASAPGAAAPA